MYVIYIYSSKLTKKYNTRNEIASVFSLSLALNIKLT